ncbi:MAG: peptidylprolyl isomerase [Eggerthellaceae bacterium]|nr:peptidylprolyl isomerase [Eggerthellaceae bacterium]
MERSNIIKPLVTAALAATCAIGLAACQGNAASGGTAATVNGTAIPESQVTETIQTVRTQSGLDDQDAWGQFLASNSMTPESVREQIIDSLVDQELVKQGTAELGVTVESSEVDTYVESMKANFSDDDAWKKALEEAGFTEESYRESIESSLLQQGVGTYFEEKAEVTDADYVESAKTYASYYDGAKRSSHILIKVDDTTDEAAMEEARAKAQDVLNQINSGSISFEEAAQQYSDDSSKDNGGDVGWDRATTFVTAYQTALDGLEEGQVSDLVESEYGIHIIKCTEVYTAPEEVTSLDQIPADFQETIKSMASSIKANNDYTAWLEELREKADIVINPMPSDVPYNVDMSKYETSDEAASDESASAEASDSSETAEASDSAESAESAESAAATTESAEASGSSESSESAQ